MKFSVRGFSGTHICHTLLSFISYFTERSIAELFPSCWYSLCLQCTKVFNLVHTWVTERSGPTGSHCIRSQNFFPELQELWDPWLRSALLQCTDPGKIFKLTVLLRIMVFVKPAVRNGRRGHLEKVAPRKGYVKFVPNRYKKHSTERHY